MFIIQFKQTPICNYRITNKFIKKSKSSPKDKNQTSKYTTNKEEFNTMFVNAFKAMKKADKAKRARDQQTVNEELNAFDGISLSSDEDIWKTGQSTIEFNSLDDCINENFTMQNKLYRTVGQTRKRQKMENDHDLVPILYAQILHRGSTNIKKRPKKRPN